MTSTKISLDVFKTIASKSTIRKSSVINKVRLAIQDVKDHEILETSIHYQSYKNLQRELLADCTHYIIKTETSDKNVVKIAVTTDVSIILDAIVAFQSDKKFSQTDEQKAMFDALVASKNEEFENSENLIDLLKS